MTLKYRYFTSIIKSIIRNSHVRHVMTYFSIVYNDVLILGELKLFSRKTRNSTMRVSFCTLEKLLFSTTVAGNILMYVHTLQTLHRLYPTLYPVSFIYSRGMTYCNERKNLRREIQKARKTLT